MKNFDVRIKKVKGSLDYFVMLVCVVLVRFKHSSATFSHIHYVHEKEYPLRYARI